MAHDKKSSLLGYLESQCHPAIILHLDSYKKAHILNVPVEFGANGFQISITDYI